MNINRFISIIAVFTLCFSALAKDTDDGLLVVFPEYDSIQLECGEMPSTSDKEVTLTCCAGFSEGISPFFSHKRISHSHTSNGVFYHTSVHKRMAVFSFYEGKYHFSRGGEAELKKAAKNGGMGFMQWYIIENYTQRPYCYHQNKKVYFRALCELNGKLCIVEAKDPIEYKTFVAKLMARKVRYAMYLDTDYGWQKWWYRDKEGKMCWRHHSDIAPFTTNFITFYKKQ